MAVVINFSMCRSGFKTGMRRGEERIEEKRREEERRGEERRGMRDEG